MNFNISEVTQIRICNERDLHYAVVAFIRKYRPDCIIVPGLGENQETPTTRYDSKCKGYASGTPDILILNKHKEYNGLAIEFKTPTGKGELSDNQASFLDALHENNFKIIISNNYEELILQLHNYFKGFIVLKNN